ncbi:MAG: MBL fold metallo-hydrolase [Bryobacteraceae bacterium]
MKLTFWGAAQTVTGSMHHLTVQDRQYLLDCGTYQGRRQDARERNSHLPFSAANIDAVVLSHAHIDHSGNLPTLTKNGFTGPIYTSPATADLCEPMLLDSAHIQEKDAEFINKRSWRRKKLLGKNTEDREITPIYSVADAGQVLQRFQRVQMHAPATVGPGVTYHSVDAGHMLGSTSVVLELEEAAAKTRLVFSGDVGRPNLPVIPDPEQCSECDYLIMESTYGDRLHQDMGVVEDKLAAAINRAANRGGRVIVPAFAVGRTQQLVFVLHQLINQQKIPSIPMFVDSPLAFRTTEVFRRSPEYLDAETNAFSQKGEDPFGFKRLRYVESVEESKALNDLRGPMVIISASGMCEAGRILHHLKNNIENPRNMVLITGFQAEFTLGRKIVEQQREVSIFGEPMRLRAEVVKLNELSGHADQRGLIQWMKPAARGLKKVFLVHGEITAQKALAAAIREQLNVPVEIPSRGQSVELLGSA